MIHGHLGVWQVAQCLVVCSGHMMCSGCMLIGTVGKSFTGWMAGLHTPCMLVDVGACVGFDQSLGLELAWKEFLTLVEELV